MSSSRQFNTVRSTAVAGLVVIAAACADTVTPTGPTLRSEPVMATTSGGAVVKSLTGLEPLLDATQNISQATAISDLGQVVGTTATNSVGTIREHGAIWEGSIFPTDLGTLAGDFFSSADAIKADGSVIVGTSSGMSQRPVRWVKINGSWVIDQLIVPTGADNCYVVDIANDGTIAGACYPIGSPPQVTLWRNGVPVQFGVGVPVAVNAVGQVVVSTASNESFVWDTRTNPVTVTPIGTLGGAYTFAQDINDLGDVVGFSQNAAAQARPFLWNAKKGIVDLGTVPAGTHGNANGINNLGQVVGSIASADNSSTHAVLWSKGKVIDLGVLSGYDVSVARAINAKNQIIGNSISTTLVNTIRATQWTMK